MRFSGIILLKAWFGIAGKCTMHRTYFGSNYDNKRMKNFFRESSESGYGSFHIEVCHHQEN
jgi:hypothetical protein